MLPAGVNASTEFCSLLQIPLVADLPVGDNLQNHVGVAPFDYTANVPSVTPRRVDSYSELAQYLILGKGTFFHLLYIFAKRHRHIYN